MSTLKTTNIQSSGSLDPQISLTSASVTIDSILKINDTIDFTSASVVGLDLLPDQTGNNGKYLTTDGTSASWQVVDLLPNQSGNSGKYLTTNGTSASWGTVDLSSYAPLSGATFTGHVSVSSQDAVNTAGVRNVTHSTSAPSGGNNGDVWLRYS